MKSKSLVVASFVVLSSVLAQPVLACMSPPTVIRIGGQDALAGIMISVDYRSIQLGTDGRLFVLYDHAKKQWTMTDYNQKQPKSVVLRKGETSILGNRYAILIDGATAVFKKYGRAAGNHLEATAHLFPKTDNGQIQRMTVEAFSNGRKKGKFTADQDLTKQNRGGGGMPDRLDIADLEDGAFKKVGGCGSKVTRDDDVGAAREEDEQAGSAAL